MSRLAIIFFTGLAFLRIAGAQVLFTGHVVDENGAPVAQARVAAQTAPYAPRDAYTGPSGAFEISLSAPGPYQVTVERAGFFRLTEPIQVQADGADLTLVLNPQREVFQSIDVGELPTPVDPAQTDQQQQLSGTEINDIPYPSSHSLRNAMKLIPGVVEDPSGGLHFHGGAEDQTRYTLNGFDITDPIDNRFSTRLAVEGVREVNLTSARESPQLGGGSAGTLAIQTDNGTDKLQYTATNFIPGVDTRGGLHFGDWTPRAGISGPIVKGRAWFSDSFDGEYSSGIITGLPSGQDSNQLWAAGNLFHTQVNLTPADILYADLLTNFDHQAHSGLGVLDPDSTTQALTDREFMTGVKENHSWAGGSMLETGFAWLDVYHRSIPMGDSLYLITPEGRSGNYFQESTQTGRRAQLFANFFPQAWHRKGRHQLQLGGDAQRLDYSGNYQRTGFEVIGLDGLPVSETTFRGSGVFERPNTALSGYLNDHWQPLGNLYVDAGVRADWDELVRRAAVSPRVSASWAPWKESRTKLTAGYAILHEATSLALFSRPLDQQSVTIPYTNGVSGAPLVSTFALGPNLRFPRYAEWSAGLQHDFGHRLSASLEGLRKRGSDGFVYAAASPLPGINLQQQSLSYGFGGNYQLTNQRRDAYDEASVSLRQSFGDQYGWMASYTRSRAVSNAVLDFSVDQPLQVANNFGPMPWDAPNRLLGWAYFPLPFRNWAAALLMDYRTGFPFSAVTGTGTVSGAVDALRYPSNLDLNLSLERRFTFRGRRLALRLGLNNLTGHRNPTAVNNTIGAPNYLQFYGDEGRHLEARIRFLGRAAK